MSSFFVVTTRFSAETFAENELFRTNHLDIKCIYGSSSQMSSSIPNGAPVFVIEMNNTLNRIEGVGLIKNEYCTNKYIRIYETGNYNRYVFTGKYRLSRDELDPILVTKLDLLLFYGKSHMKRGSGLLQVPAKLLKHESCQDICIKTIIKDTFTQKFKIKSKPVENNKENSP